MTLVGLFREYKPKAADGLRGRFSGCFENAFGRRLFGRWRMPP